MLTKAVALLASFNVMSSESMSSMDDKGKDIPISGSPEGSSTDGPLVRS